MAQKFDPETNSWFFYGKIKDALGIQRQYKKRGFPTKKAAKKAEIEFRENAIAPPAKITMFALEEEFIAWMKRQITESSINSYHYLFDRINARFGDIPPTAITSQLLQLYIDELIIALRYANLGPASALYTLSLWWKRKAEDMEKLGYLEDAEIAKANYEALDEKVRTMWGI